MHGTLHRFDPMDPEGLLVVEGVSLRAQLDG